MSRNQGGFGLWQILGLVALVWLLLALVLGVPPLEVWR